MRTKTIAVLLSLAMLLALLPACGAEKEPEEPASPEVLLPAEDIARAVSSAAPDESEDGPESLGEQLEEYVEAAYGLNAEDWEDGYVLRATGVRAYEIAVLRFAGEAETAYGEEQLGAYCNSRQAAFTGYAPDEATLVSGAKICRIGNYVGLFICEDPKGAEELFTSILESGEVPEVIVKPELEPEPEPVAEPEPVTDMDSLAEALMDACREEIDEINTTGGLVSIANPRFTKGFAEMMESVYGISADQWVDGFVVDDLTGKAFELVVLRMADQETAETGRKLLDEYWERLKDDHSEWRDGVRYVSEEDSAFFDDLCSAHLTCSGEFLAFLVCRDAENVKNVLNNGIRAVLQAEREQSEESGYQNPEEPLFVEIAEGVIVTEARWPEPEGEADPDHPGRLKYVPTGNELMEIYDTSAIVAAWEAGDPSGLSDYDRAIYDNAKEVLDGILRDGMSSFEKEVEIYDWILRNVRYYATHMDALAEDERDAYTPCGGLVNREAVCLGYAATFQLLTELAGLESMTVVGVAEMTEDHGWAMVRLNGEWYCVDPTWDASAYEFGTMDGREWCYFNVTSDYMVRTHHQWDYDAVPEATAGDYGVPTR